ncbi:MAG TPA: dihydrodipicolinate synthase family protein [Armatimonadota bacterium]|nr:dihydrodipicolinate synthase family protein [Armatimonadota bacterium]
MNPLGINGIIPPVLTLYNPDDSVDEPSMRRLIRFLVDNGAAALFAMGSSAEFPLLSDVERRQITELIMDEAAGAVPVLMGTIAEGPGRVLELAKDAAAIGATAIVVTAPYYFGWNVTEMERYLRRIADEAPLPVVLYDIPGRTQNPIAIDTILALSEHPNVVGLKDTTTDGGRFVNMLLQLEGRDDFALYQGSEPLGLPSFILGADGAVFSLANIAPKTSVALYDTCVAGDIEEGRKLQALYNRLFALFTILDPGTGSIGGGLGGLKVALELLGISGPKVRFPSNDTPDGAREKVAAVLRTVPETAEMLG